MKDFKKYAKKEKKEIADADREFLEQTLYPIVDKNIKEKPPRKKRWLCAEMIVAVCFVVILSVGIGVGVYCANDGTEEFADHLANKSSDIATANGELENTQLIGEFGYVTLNYWARKGTSAIFTVVKETEEPDVTYISGTLDIIVDPNYAYEFVQLNNTLHTEFLGYSLNYNIKSETYTDNDMTIYDYVICAYLDTGKERYIIRYNKLSIYDGTGFDEFLKNTIIRK